jgi:MarR family transcriptional regulator, transcriptional regulator for hemolysin
MDTVSSRGVFVEELTTVNRKLRTLFDARARAHGLTFARARLLLYLSKMEGCTQKELADVLEVEQPSVVNMIDALEESGLLERRAVEGDRRAKQLVLTDAARIQAKDVIGFAEEMRRQVLDGVDEADLLAATRVLRVITNNVGALS